MDFTETVETNPVNSSSAEVVDMVDTPTQLPHPTSPNFGSNDEAKDASPVFLPPTAAVDTSAASLNYLRDSDAEENRRACRERDARQSLAVSQTSGSTKDDDPDISSWDENERMSPFVGDIPEGFVYRTTEPTNLPCSPPPSSPPTSPPPLPLKEPCRMRPSSS